MQEQDIQAWERELNHSQLMQKQREGWDGKQVRFAGSKTYEVPKAIYSNEIYQAKENDNEK